MEKEKKVYLHKRELSFLTVDIALAKRKCTECKKDKKRP